MVFGNFLVNGQNLSFRLVDDLDVRGDLGGAGPDGNMLALLDNVHQLVIIIALDGRLEGADIAVQSGALDVGDDLVYNADQFFVVLCRRQSLNGNTCSHNQYLLKIGAGSRAENENAPAGSAGKGVQTHEQKTVMFPTLA